MHRLPYLLLGLGLIALAGAGLTWFFSQQDWNSELPLVDVENKDDNLWSRAKHVDTKNLQKVTLWHVLNPEEVLQGHKPHLTEKGPYVYEEMRKRIVVDENLAEEKATYKDHVTYFFRPELSRGTEDDIVTIINVPYVGLASEMVQMNFLSRTVVIGIVSRYNESIFMTRPVRELLYGGFYHELMATFSSITGENYMPNNTFGLLYGRNNTYTNSRKISLNPSTFGNTLALNNQTEMSWYGSSECNRFKGSDWHIPHPHVSVDNPLEIFLDEQCRNWNYGFKSQVSYEGVTAFRFTIPDSELKGDNECFCPSEDDDDEDRKSKCPKDGAYSISACSKGAAVFLSLPHFLHADKSYIKNLKGLNPNPHLHETFVDIEPNSGQILKSSRRTQVNIRLRPLKLSITEFRKVPDVIFPFMWTDETSEVQRDELLKLQTNSGDIPSIALLFSAGLSATGIVLITISVFVFLLRLRKKDYVA